MQVLAWWTMPTHFFLYLAFLPLLGEKNISSAVLYMYSISAIFFVSKLHWNCFITKMACKVQFLRSSLSTKNKNKNFAKYCLYNLKLNLATFLVFYNDTNSNAALSATVNTYMQPIHNIREKIFKKI